MANETPVSDDELEGLMAELEEATGVSAVAIPAPKAPVAAVAPTADELDELEELEVAETPAPAAPVALTPEDPNSAIVMEDEEGATMVLPSTTSAAPNIDDELAALEAEIASGTVAPPETPPWETQVHAASAPHVTEKIDSTDEAWDTRKLGASEAHAAVAEIDPPKIVEAVRTAPKPTPKPTPTISPEEEEAIATATKKKAAASLDHYIDVDAFKAEMQVTETNLDNCMMQQASLRAFNGARAARAEAQASSIKARFEVREAQLYNQHRTALTVSGEKVTEKAVENAVKTDPKWIAMKIMVIEAESIAAVAKSCVAALSDRRDMIIQLGADRRDESKGQARIMQAQADRDQLTNRAVSAARQTAA